MSKGSTPRPVDRKKWDSNWEVIDWSKKKGGLGAPEGPSEPAGEPGGTPDNLETAMRLWWQSDPASYFGVGS